MHIRNELWPGWVGGGGGGGGGGEASYAWTTCIVTV